VEVAVSVVKPRLRELDQEKLERLEKIVRSMGQFSMFKTLDEHELKRILPDLKVCYYEQGDVVINQGDYGRYLYIVLSGRFEVLGGPDGKSTLATLGPGEVFGEMSLLSGNVCTATIRGMEKSRLLSLDGDVFRRTVERLPALQQYLFRLITGRMAKTNLLREAQLSQGIRGKLSDLSLAELLQALNLSRKSGALEVGLSRGAGHVFMGGGEVVGAEYVGKNGPEALCEMLTETDGTFAYSPDLPASYEGAPKIGEFMNLLMEGLVRIDEAVKEADA
jgi:CRP-like cAMP-binding protein